MLHLPLPFSKVLDLPDSLALEFSSPVGDGRAWAICSVHTPTSVSQLWLVASHNTALIFVVLVSKNIFSLYSLDFLLCSSWVTPLCGDLNLPQLNSFSLNFLVHQGEWNSSSCQNFSWYSLSLEEVNGNHLTEKWRKWGCETDILHSMQYVVHIESDTLIC